MDFSKLKKLYIIGEIGVNHNGSLKIAKKLIYKAKKAGFDGIKIQSFKTENLLLKNTKLAEYQKKNVKSKNMFELLKKYELSDHDTRQIKIYCSKLNIDFLSTPFDLESANYLNKIKVKMFKISSSDNNNFLLLGHVKKFNKPIILSLGMTEKKDLPKTIKFLKLKKNKLVLMHCISDYPTLLSNAQLGYLNYLKKFNYTLGWSDHTIGNEAAIIAISLGAKVIEKHITLNKKMKGPDHKASLEEKNFNSFVKTLRIAYANIIQKNRRLTREEKETKLVSKKSIYYSVNLKKNTKIQLKYLSALRPEKKNGISPNNLNLILNKRLKKNVLKNDFLKIEDLK